MYLIFWKNLDTGEKSWIKAKSKEEAEIYTEQKLEIYNKDEEVIYYEIVDLTNDALYDKIARLEKKLETIRDVAR